MATSDAIILHNLEFPDRKRPVILCDYDYQQHPILFEMPAHSHDFYEILFFESDNGAHYIDFEEMPVIKHRAYLILPGQIHYINDINIKAKALLFDKSFINISELQLQMMLPVKETKFVDIPEDTLPVFQKLFELITMEQQNEAINFNLIRNYIQALLLSLNKYYNTAINEKLYSRLSTVFKLIEEHYSTERDADFYASRMQCSEKYLSAILKSATGKSLKQHIDHRMILEIKKQLLLFDKPINAIAYELRFEDASYFGRFFKKNTGFTPLQFREKASLYHNSERYPFSKWANS